MHYYSNRFALKIKTPMGSFPDEKLDAYIKTFKRTSPGLSWIYKYVKEFNIPIYENMDNLASGGELGHHGHLTPLWRLSNNQG